MPNQSDAADGQDSSNHASSTPVSTPPGDTVGTNLLAEAGERSMTNSEYYSPIPDGYKKGNHKYVVILGTVMSGLGKGIFSSSMAKVLKDKGLRVAPIKCEGYLNIDSGTLNPYRHGEVFVLDDGTECDMDLGTYERMLNQNLTKRNFVTSGQIYSEILDRERQGVYLGRDVQMIPHVTGEVKRKLRELALRGDGEGPADVVFVEVGGTVGDYENGFYIEALRELAFEEGPGSVCFVALTYVIEPKALGEQKSKAAQLGIKRLMESGIQPHLIACRASNPAESKVMEKIAMFSNVPKNRVFSMHDRDSIYTIPDEMRNEGLDREILSILDLHNRVDAMQEDKSRRQWGSFVEGLVAPKNYTIKVAVAGKYADLMDAYASIQKSLEHCAAHFRCRIRQEWIDTTDISDSNVAQQLDGFDGVIVPGGFGSRGVEGKISVVKYCRESGMPYLGICLGFQVAVIEFARNVLGIKDAYSTEFDPMCGSPLISELPDQKKIEGLGGTMRLGAQDVQITPDSLAAFLAGGKRSIHERFRHRYEVDPSFIDQLEAGGLVFSGRHPEQPIMQILELPSSAQSVGHDDNENGPTTHPYFIGAQFHPELTSRPLTPQPMFMGLVAASLAGKYESDESEWNTLYSGNAALRTWLYTRKNGKTQPTS
ncbi:MAG: CTP synthase (glutamine hydrolyzing) [Phycisphaerales bacterium]|nr:CTP synthase (glutamine hydrolyzing) [Phycisphaerales bacterium]